MLIALITVVFCLGEQIYGEHFSTSILIKMKKIFTSQKICLFSYKHKQPETSNNTGILILFFQMAHTTSRKQGKVQNLRPGAGYLYFLVSKIKPDPPDAGQQIPPPLPEAKRIKAPLHDFTIEK